MALSDSFLGKFADRDNYQDADIYQFERRRERPYNPTSSVSWGPSPLQQGFQSRGMMDQVGRPQKSNPDTMGGNPTAGLLGIQNTTGFSQEAPNVVYDYRPEEAAKDRKLQSRELDIREMQARGVLENNAILNETRMMNAMTAQERNEIARMKAQNPNLIFKQTLGGNWVAMDPATGQAMDTGVGTGTMTQQGALELRGQNAMNVAEANNQAAMMRTMLMQMGMNERQASQLAQDKATEIFRAGNNVWATRERGRDPEKIAAEVFNTDPEMAKFIQIAPNGSFQIKPTATMNSGFLGQGPEVHDPSTPTAEQRAKLISRIYGQTPPPNLSWPSAPPNAGNNNPSQGLPTGELGPNQIQIKPEQMGMPSGLGFGGAINNLGGGDRQQGFTAQPGQFTAPQGGQQPQQGGAFTTGNPQQDAQLRQQAVALLEKRGMAVTEANINATMSKLNTSSMQSTTAPGQLAPGVVAGQSAGTLSGPSAGTVRR